MSSKEKLYEVALIGQEIEIIDNVETPTNGIYDGSDLQDFHVNKLTLQ